MTKILLNKITDNHRNANKKNTNSTAWSRNAKPFWIKRTGTSAILWGLVSLNQAHGSPYEHYLSQTLLTWLIYSLSQMHGLLYYHTVF